jgi:ABC-2 type transport system permease protein
VNFFNTKLLTRLILRRERINSTMWIIITSVFLALIAFMFINGMDMDATSRQAMADVMQNPAMVAMVGPIIGEDNFTVGAMYTTMMLVFTALAIIVMNILFVVRHTRADEERGRYEVLRSLPVGRLSGLAATLISAVLVNVALGLLAGVLLFAAGDYSMCFSGSMLWGALLAAVGIVFATIAALFSQLCSNSRSAMGYSFAVMGVFYMMRAIGDVSAPVLSMVSPVGIIVFAEAWVSNNWWVVPLTLLFAIPPTLLAFRINLIRDIDQGVIADKQGRATAGVLLQTPFGLSLRLLKVSLIVGLSTIFFVALSYGSVMGDVDGFIASNEFYQMLLSDAEDIPSAMLFAGMINFIMGMMALIPSLLYILRARGEEKDSRAELVLAGAVCRKKYLGSYVIIGFVASVFMQVLTALGLWIMATSVLPNPADFPLPDVLIANLLFLPAIWVILGVTVFLIGFAPKLTSLIWLVYGFVFFMGMFGRMDFLPRWVQGINPFHYIPEHPIQDITILPLIVLVVIATCFTVVGFIGYSRRDITA